MLSRTARCMSHRATSYTNVVAAQKIVYRRMHLVCQVRNISIKSPVLKISKYSSVLGTCTKRYASTNDTVQTIANESVVAAPTVASPASPIVPDVPVTPPISETSGQNAAEGLTSKLLETIPDAPIPPVIEAVSFVGEPTFAELGLANYTPVGLIQKSLEIMHVGCGLPWWEAIAIGTLCIRLLVFPLVIVAQRNGAQMSNNMPELQRLQQEMTEARQCGDQITAARKGSELMVFMKEKKCHPLKNMLIPMVQAPIFISVFMGLRKMAELPVQSMKEGGLWWFTDLTVPDQYYLLPLITATTLAITIEVGTDSTRVQALGWIRYILRAIPVILFPFIINFPAAILCYWTSSNFISLIQVAILRIPKVRTFFKIESLVQHRKAVLGQKKGFVEGIKSSISNMKMARQVDQRSFVDAAQFQQAGKGPIEPTFAYDPTKQTSKKIAATIMAKRR